MNILQIKVFITLLILKSYRNQYINWIKLTFDSLNIIILV